MIQTWRWFGPNDPVSLPYVKQSGATGIVSALHHVPHGDVWTVEEINKRKAEIEAAGLTWDVVESITVHESIKTRSGNFQEYIEKYKQSIRNVAACGIPVITYNFMPVNDWTRTQLDYVMPDGSEALYFNWVDLAIFDIYILQRENASASFPENIVAKAKDKHSKMSAQDLQDLADVVMFGIPGEKKMTVEGMREALKAYDNIDRDVLRSNLTYFLNEICPVADEVGVKLAIHPDDPPFDILGLPRIVNCMEDYEYILSNAPYKSNGICFCTGSLGANTKNDLPEIVKQLDDKIHFIHLRNVRSDEEGNFFEADHLDGNTDMYAVVKELLLMQQKHQLEIPFRPDHGHQMLDDLGKVNNPGYSAIGRLRGLAELRGLEEGIIRSL
ncbi:mannonate dehydratase [Flavobacterium agrisoli]|uniref:Mannonate dehydratase n=1 Tax=Flavobacterium agrisoli TaxID=2793066 RepID=A0A934PMR3_9FLAO|nr:mannonate dehydratase [Flavobacterium agrisoli]MBK0369253.1 mannonate dehydratase [Flavobacterium agrisoli]